MFTYENLEETLSYRVLLNSRDWMYSAHSESRERINYVDISRKSATALNDFVSFLLL